MDTRSSIMRDARYIDDMRALLQAVVDRTRAANHDGASLDDVRKKIDLAPFRPRFGGDDPFLERAFDRYFTQPAIERAYQEANGKLEDE
jgi:hypothetical protein